MGIEHSQNYLHSKQLVATLLSKSNICNDDIVIEIGPGLGARPKTYMLESF